MTTILTFSIFFLFLTSSHCTTQIITQQFTTQHFTDADIMNWSPFGTSLPQIKFTQCGSHRIVGGYGVLKGDTTTPNGITRTFSSLIPHYKARITLDMYKIDSWVNHSWFLQVDGITIKTLTFSATNGGTTDTCGMTNPITNSIDSNFNQVITPIDIIIDHYSTTMTITMTSNLVNYVGSWGIRNVKITMQTCQQSCLSCTNATVCTLCDSSNGLTAFGPLCDCANTMDVKQQYIPCSVMPCVVCLSSLPCSPGFYYSTTTGDCQPCNSACSTCTTPSNTLTTCSSCSLGYAGNPPTSLCTICYYGCASCATTAINSCLSCSIGYFYISTTNRCVTECPDGMYGVQSSRSCVACAYPCQNCIGSGGNYYCLSCLSGLFVHQYICHSTCPSSLVGYNRQCIQSCPQRTYLNTPTSTCINCSSYCLQCTSSSCLICQSNTYILLGICYLICPVRYYQSNTPYCLSCHSTCFSCNGPFVDNCMSCNGGDILISNICYSTCPTRTYGGGCDPCHSTCLTCNGPLNNNCLSCSSPMFYHLNASTCSQMCQYGDISDNQNFTCYRCGDGMTGYFKQCVGCHASCRVCDGVSFLSCTGCRSGQILLHSACLLQDRRQIIKTYQGTNTTTAFMIILIIHLVLCFVLQILFMHKTSLLITVQTLQILSLSRYFKLQLSHSTQQLANFIYNSNFSTLINWIMLQPNNMPTIFVVRNKTGIFVDDSLGIQIIMLVCIIIFLSVKYLSTRVSILYWMYGKFNPYFLSYLFRLMLLQFSFSAFIFLYHIELSSIQNVLSLVLLGFDMVLVLVSACWRIRSKQDGVQLALFYHNEIGQPHNKNNKQNTIANGKNNDNNMQDRIKARKVLLFLADLLIKIPFVISIALFAQDPSTQILCYTLCGAIYVFMSWVIPYRRKIYRIIIRINAIIILINGLLAILIQYNMANSVLLDGLWMGMVVIMLTITLMQALTNYKYIKHLFVRLKQKCIQRWQSTPDQSQSNLTQSICQEHVVVAQKISNSKEEESGLSQLDLELDYKFVKPTRDVMDKYEEEEEEQPRLDLNLQ